MPARWGNIGCVTESIYRSRSTMTNAGVLWCALRGRGRKNVELSTVIIITLHPRQKAEEAIEAKLTNGGGKLKIT